MTALSRIRLPHDQDEPLDDVLDRVDAIARQLGDLKAHLLTSPPAMLAEPPALTAVRIRRQLKARRARERHFGGDMFADPAWDILLEAYAAHLEEKDTSITALCNAAAVPSTTALRWIKKLEEVRFLRRRSDPSDGRRSWIEITPLAAAKMRQYLDAISVTLPF